MNFTYGPVPSRRLGISLGLSIVPFKTCTLDCVYCQCGRTTCKTLERESFYPIEDVLVQVRAAVRQSEIGNRKSEIAYLTFSGEGEPTLNKDIGKLIRRLKQEYSIPVAVITNGTLLTDPAVRRDLLAADLVVPSLDAADQRNFARVGRGHRNLKVEDIVEGLVKFRRCYKGQMWLEIMLVKGVNDSVEHLVKLRKAVHRIKPDRVHLNTVVRPPAEKSARPLSEDDLEQIQHLFGPGTEIASSRKCRSPKSKVRSSASVISTSPFAHDPAQAIIQMLKGRPSTRKDMESSLGINPDRFAALLGTLVRQRRIKRVNFRGKTFFEPA